MRELDYICTVLFQGSGESAHRDPNKYLRTENTIFEITQLIKFLNFLRGRTFTVFEAGFALNTHGSFVKGFTPLRAGFARVFFNFKFKAPQNLKEPFFFIWSAAIPTRASKAPFTSFGLHPAFSATARYAADAVMTFGPPPFTAATFSAFMAFID